jgi:hypothetical protein
MRSYYDLIQHLKTTFEEDVNVNTVVSEGYPDIDHWRKSIFPIVDINVIGEDETGNTAITRFNVEITVLDIRDFNKEDVNDKFWRNDNRHDIWNTTHAILKTARNKLIKDHLNTDITVDSYTSAERMSAVLTNTLDGWQQTFTIDVPDTFTTIC